MPRSLSDLVDAFTVTNDDYSVFRERAVDAMGNCWAFKINDMTEKYNQSVKDAVVSRATAQEWIRRSKMEDSPLSSASNYEITKDLVPEYISQLQQQLRLRSILEVTQGKFTAPWNQPLAQNENFRSLARKEHAKLRDHLQQLLSTVGHDTFKSHVYEKLVAFFLDYRQVNSFHNMVLMGPAGIGKSHLAQLYAKILASSGMFLSDTIRTVSRQDLVAEYVGQTAVKTRAALMDAYEGVLFIDEAYSLAQESKDDAYGSEAITEIIAFLSENKPNICVVAAGYEDEMMNKFLPANPGLSRRFPYLVKLQLYSREQMSAIFEQMMLGMTVEDATCDYLKANYMNQQGVLVRSDVVSDLFRYAVGDLRNIVAVLKRICILEGTTKVSPCHLHRALKAFAEANDREYTPSIECAAAKYRRTITHTAPDLVSIKRKVMDR